MELQKKSELSVGTASFVISTQLEGEAAPAIQTRVFGGDGNVVFETSQDISALKPIFQNSQKIFSRLEAQHHAVVKELEQGRIPGANGDTAAETGSGDKESDALAHAVQLMTRRNFEKATAALRAVLETYPNCSEARELLEVAYKASSDARLPVDVALALKRGVEAFAAGRQREAIESWKQCLIEEPGNRRLQLLVLLATTWSPTRRQTYASEVLAPGSHLLNAGRTEEAQALLLVAQTVESPAAQTLPGARPVGTPGGAPAEPRPASSPSSPGDETIVRAPDFEDLVTDDLELSDETSGIDDEEVEVEEVEPVPDVGDPEENENTILISPPSAAAQADPVSGAAPPAAAKTRPAAAENRPDKPQPATGPEAKSPPPASPTPRLMARKPLGRARRSTPWPLLGAGAALVVVIGGVLVWSLSGDATVPPSRIEEAASLASSGRYTESIAAYDNLVTEYGETAAIFLGRGRAKLAAGDSAGGVADLERAHASDTQNAAIAEELGDVLYSQGMYPDSISYYEKAFAGGGGSAEGRYRLAVSLVREGRGDAAIDHLHAAIGKDPMHGEAQFLYGQLLNGRGRHQEAEKALRAAKPNVEAGSDYLAQLGLALLEQQKLDEAEETARDFIRSYPTDARARSLLGEVYLSRKQYEPARAQLIQALRTNPREPRAQLALGRTWLAIGRSRGDAQDLAKAHQVLSTAQGVHEGQRLLALGQVSLAEGKLDAARNLLQQALQRGAPPLQVHLALAEAKWRAEDFVGVAEELQRASGLAPGDAAISLSLAITYSQLKDTTRAAEEFLRTIQGVGLVAPPGAGSGPVVLPEPYVPIPARFDVNRTIRDAYQAILKNTADDSTATELRTLSESTTFLLGGAG